MSIWNTHLQVQMQYLKLTTQAQYQSIQKFFQSKSVMKE